MFLLYAYWITRLLIVMIDNRANAQCLLRALGKLVRWCYYLVMHAISFVNIHETNNRFIV